MAKTRVLAIWSAIELTNPQSVYIERLLYLSVCEFRFNSIALGMAKTQVLAIRSAIELTNSQSVYIERFWYLSQFTRFRYPTHMCSHS